MTGHAVHYSSASSEWYTPAHVAALARQVLGTIALDPASCAEANTTIQAATYYDQATNGLQQQWYGRVWLNPPYGDDIKHWIPRLVGFYEAGYVSEAIALVPARTDTEWFQSYLFAGVLCFWRGRLRFSNAEHSAPFLSVAVYFGPNVDRFRAVFAPHGRITRAISPAPQPSKRHKPIQTLFV